MQFYLTRGAKAMKCRVLYIHTVVVYRIIIGVDMNMLRYIQFKHCDINMLRYLG